ncbi:MAG: COX15/CtaA family protein [Pseudomonadota bacterium]
MSKRSIFEEVGAEARTAAAPAPGAAEARKAGARRAVRIWLWTLALLLVAMVVVGGLTRLTDSGLSITEWAPVMGAIPPLSQADWDAAFAAYKTTDEFRLQNSWMTLADFKPIYWWEWGHRFLGRVIGIVWLLPLLFFAVRGMIPRGWGFRLTLLGILGGLQGAIGWWMVYSGLSERLDVAPYRLATHLGLAFLIFALIVWYILKLGREDWVLLQARRRRSGAVFAWAVIATTALFLQILFGALVAGTDAWSAWNTWPLMDGDVIAPEAFEMAPLWVNFFENPAMTQFVHRTAAFVVAAVAVVYALVALASRHGPSARWAGLFVLGVLAQGVYGIYTLLMAAPVEIAIFHQLGALILLAIALRAKFEAAYPTERRIRA